MARMTATAALDITPVTTVVGSVVQGMDISRPLPAGVVEQLHEALRERGVLFFRNQALSAQQMHDFATYFGRPIPEPAIPDPPAGAPAVGENDLQPAKMSTSVWHSDTTFVPEPPQVTVLRAVQIPPVGGDTLWANMYAAYDALSPPRELLDGLTAVHTSEDLGRRSAQFTAERAQALVQRDGAAVVHPVVRAHPVTGRKALFVNESSCTTIVELTKAEGAHVLALLFEHVKAPDFMMRWRWTPNDVALWDNCAVQHYAVPDYTTTRIMQRVVTAGPRPQGPRPQHRGTS
jgi:alpha-ketoglutarate-dependent taurine dioxygenase